MTRKLSRKKEFYVYALLDPRKPGPFYYGHWKFSHEPFYIGKGKATRAWQHTGADYNTYKSRKILSIIRTGVEPLVIIKKRSLTEKQAFDLEIRLIELVGRYNLKEGPLTNCTRGGEGVVGIIITEETRQRMVISARNRSSTPEQRKSLSDRVTTWWANISDKEYKIWYKAHHLRDKSKDKHWAKDPNSCKIVVDKVKKAKSSMSGTRKAEYSSNLSSSVSAYYANPENKRRIKRQHQLQQTAYRSRSNADKQRTSKQMSDSAKLKYENMSTSDRKALAERNTIAALARNTPEKRIARCTYSVFYRGKNHNLVELLYKLDLMDWQRHITERIRRNWDFNDAIADFK